MTLKQVSQDPYQDHDCVTGSLLGYDISKADLHMIPMFCHRWTCPRCRKHKANKYRAVAYRGSPERFITLTVKHVEGQSSREVCEQMKKAFRKLVQKIRKELGKFEYFLVWELTKKGTPHIHLLQRGCYVPKSWLSKAWCELTGSYIVSLRFIKSASQVYQYISKYMGKELGRSAEALTGLRIIQKSRNYVVLEEEKNMESPGQSIDEIDSWCYCSGTPSEIAEVLKEQFGLTLTADSDSGHLVFHGDLDPDIVEKICFMFDDERSFSC